MKPKVLLVNPWIYDFAAMNLWSRPLGLLRVAEYLSQFDIDLTFIDCTDSFKRIRTFGNGNYFRTVVEKPEILRSFPRDFARYGISLEDFIERIRVRGPFDIVLVTSIMSYWYPGVQKVIEILRGLSPGSPIVLGGIYATLYHDHASRHSGADILFMGGISADLLQAEQGRSQDNPQKETLKEILDRAGIGLTKTGPPRPYYKLPLYEKLPFAPIMTSAGCPYSCAYCASFSLSPAFIQRDPSDIIHEIEALSTLGVRDYAFYDDALLVNADAHIRVVLTHIIKSGLNVRFHCPNGLHARCIDEDLARLMKSSGFTTLRLSLETVNATRQQQTGGKVSTDMFMRAVRNLKKAGFTKNETGAYIMYGLPGQEFNEVDEGVEFLKHLGVRIYLSEFSPIPGTSCWRDLVSQGTLSDDIDPLLTNNSVYAALYSGYSMTAIQTLKKKVLNYNRLPDQSRF